MKLFPSQASLFPGHVLAVRARQGSNSVRQSSEIMPSRFKLVPVSALDESVHDFGRSLLR